MKLIKLYCSVNYKVERLDSIENIKRKLQNKEGISANEFHLNWGGKPLKEQLTVADYSIPKESTLNVYAESCNLSELNLEERPINQKQGCSKFFVLMNE